MDAADEVEVDQDKPEQEKKSDNVFKKPVLIGKIGKLPKALSTDNVSEYTSNADNRPPDQESSLTKEAEDINQKPVKGPVQGPAQQLMENLIPLPYQEPPWSGLPKSTSKKYKFEILKNGAIIETIDLMSKPFWTFGRLNTCDINMQHPTISRYHAVLQYRQEDSEIEEPGFYIYDLGSTHGTFLNKNRVKPKVFVRMQVGHMLKLGCSTRSYILNGPDYDEEEESELTVTELKQKREEDIQKLMEEKLKFEKELEEKRKKEQERGVDWGLGEDADEETDLSENPYAQTNNEELYLDDPKKALRGFFEREGLDLEYDCNEQGIGQFLCKIELPIDDEMGRPIVAEVLIKGKKKEAVVQCALEACRILDRHGVLRQATHESRKRKAKNWEENDYYDSDEDTFLDRTGTIEKKREKRMNKKVPQRAETFESLTEKEKEISEKISSLEKQILMLESRADLNSGDNNEEDSLDTFMKDLKDTKVDNKSVNKMKVEIAKLRTEQAKLIRLINMVKPAPLPPLVPEVTPSTSKDSKQKTLPMFGKRKKIQIKYESKSNYNTAANDDIDDETQEEHDDEKMQVNLEEANNRESERDTYSSNEGVNTVEGVTNNTDGDSVPEQELDNQTVFNNFKNSLQHVFKTDGPLKDQTETPGPSLDRQNSPSGPKAITSGKADNGKVKSSANDHKKVPESQAVKDTQSSTSDNSDESSDENLSIEVKNNDGSEASKRKKKNQRRIQQRVQKAEQEKRKGYDEDAARENYSMWVPPSDQAGDGRTSLNDKYGY